MNEINNNKVNLCDSCSQVYPDCTSKPENVYFGDGVGHDNICACSEYRPKTCGDGDTISRQDTVDVIASMITYHKTLDDAYWYVKDDAPSAQPEIIRCCDCKHMQEDKIFHQCWCDGREVKPDHFCGYAERKEDAFNSRNKTC